MTRARMRNSRWARSCFGANGTGPRQRGVWNELSILTPITPKLTCSIGGSLRLILRRAESQPRAFTAMQLAITYGEAGNMEMAFRHLDRAMESHDPGLVYIAVGPQWDSLRGDPRYTAALQKMNLA